VGGGVRDLPEGVLTVADNLKDRAPEDAKRISLKEDWEVKYWTKSLGVSEPELKRLVKEHGPMVEDVRKFAKK